VAAYKVQLHLARELLMIFKALLSPGLFRRQT